MSVLTHRDSVLSPALRAGFSLIELLMVVVMVGLVSMFALPRMRLERNQVEAATRSVGMAMMVAQREAVSRGHNVLVVFDTAKRSVRTVWDANSNLTQESAEKSRPFPWPDRIVMGRAPGVPALGTAAADIPTMLTLSGAPMLVMQRNGGTDRAVTLYFTSLRAKKGMTTDMDTRAVVIDRATGRPSSYVYTASGWRRM